MSELNDDKFLYSTDGKNWKRLGEIKEIEFVPAVPEEDESLYTALKEPVKFEAVIKFRFSREVSRSLHFIHSKKLRTRKKHAKKLLRILAGIAR